MSLDPRHFERAGPEPAAVSDTDRPDCRAGEEAPKLQSSSSCAATLLIVAAGHLGSIGQFEPLRSLTTQPKTMVRGFAGFPASLPSFRNPVNSPVSWGSCGIVGAAMYVLQK